MKLPRRNQPGQSVVILALFLITLVIFLGVGIDSGALYLGRRHLQNISDAACLAAATDLAMGRSAAIAEATAQTYITDNLDANARLGFVRGSLNVGRPIVTTGDVRVELAIRANAYFLRVAGIETYNVFARTRCGVSEGGGFSPIAVNRFPGYTNNGARRLGMADTTQTLPQYYTTGKSRKALQVRDVLQASSGVLNDGPLGSTGCGSNRRNWYDWPSLGDAATRTGPFNDPCPEAGDPLQGGTAGPEVEIVGRGANANVGSSSFTGQVFFDVRNVAAGPTFYNGAGSTSANAWKQTVIEYMLTQYPGPDVEVGEQLGVLSGVNAGLLISAMDTRYNPGDELTALVYNGQVFRANDFQLTLTCQAGQGPITTGPVSSRSCNNDGTNGGNYVYREAVRTSPSFFNSSCQYRSEYFAGDGSYSYPLVGGAPLATPQSGLNPARYVVQLEPVRNNTPGSALTIRLRARISGLNGGGGFGNVRVRWLDASSSPLTGWQNPDDPVEVTMPSTGPVQAILEVIQTATTTATCPSTGVTYTVPDHVYGAQMVQVSAVALQSSVRHTAYGVLGMYRTNTGSPYDSGDYFLSFAGDAVGRAEPGETITAKLLFINANTDNDLSFSSLPTTSISVNSTLAGVTAAIVRGSANDPELEIRVPAGAAPGDYTVDVQVNSTPEHSSRFHLRVADPGNPSIDEWVVALCYARFRISTITSNTVTARAISGCMSPSEVTQGLTSRMLPW